jgi:hypothetical protein
VRGALDGGSEVMEAEASIRIWVADICGNHQREGEKKKNTHCDFGKKGLMNCESGCMVNALGVCAE